MSEASIQKVSGRTHYPLFSILPLERFVYVHNEITTPASNTEQIQDIIQKIKSETLFKVLLKNESEYQVMDCLQLSQFFNFSYLTHLNFFHEKVLRQVLLNKPLLFVLANEQSSSNLEKFEEREEMELNFKNFQLKSSCYHNHSEIISFLNQGHLVPNLVIKFINDSMGYGLFTDEIIPKGTFIGEYTGLVNTASENNVQIRQVDGGDSYFNPLAYCCEYPSCEGDVLIDAFELGNVIRFINHSDDPLKTNSNMWRCEDHEGLPHVICIANRDIQSGEQVMFNYGPSYWKNQMDNKIEQ